MNNATGANYTTTTNAWSRRIGALKTMFWLSATAATAAPAPVFLSDQPGLLLSADQGWGKMGLDTAAHAPGEVGEPLRIGGKSYAKGIGHHADGSISVPLEGAFVGFDAEVGLHPCGAGGSVVFRVLVDDQCRFDSGVMKMGDAPKAVHVPLDGADELRLEARDAGDGIICDMANWADARLTRHPSAQLPPRADIAPFARVVSSDPSRALGTAAKRNEEFPAEDLFLESEVRPSPGGAYSVPAWGGGIGCIGLRWHELRSPRELRLQFVAQAAAPPAETIQLQFWAGESPWQGAWKPLPATARKADDRCIWQIDPRAIVGGTQKVRWIFPASPQPIGIRAFSAAAAWSWKTADIRIESTRPAADKQGRVDIYNGHFASLSDGEFPQELRWDLSAPLRVAVRYSRPQRVNVDRTVLRFDLAEGAFAVAIEDVLANGAVYIPHAGLFVTRDPAPITLADYVRRMDGRKTVLQKVRELPDQTFSQAMAVTHNPIQDLGPMLVSLACDNRKFTVHRDGTITFAPGDEADGTYPNLHFTATSDVPGGAGGQPIKLGFDYRQLIPRFGSGKKDQLERHLDGGWLPRPVVSVRDNGAVYSQRTYVAPMDRQAPAGAPGWLRDRAVCVVEFTMENPGPHETTASLSLALPRRGKNEEAANFEPVKEGFRVTQADRLVGLFETGGAGPLAAAAASGQLTVSGRLPSGKSARLVVYLPAWKLNPSDYGVLLGGANWAAEMESYWNEVLASAMRVELPDALLNNIIRASQVHCLLAARNEGRGRRVAAWCGSDRYQALESESHAPIRGMCMTGCTDYARRSLEYFIHRYNKPGFLTTGYTIVGTGEHLWTLAEHFERTGDVAWFRQIAPEVARVCQWVAAQRAKTRMLDARGERVPEYGLMPPGVSADWARFAYRFFNEAQYCAGLEAAARALARVNHPEAPSLLEDARQYREDILRAYRWTQARSPVIPLSSGAWVPYYPSMLDCFGNIDGFLPGEDGNRSWAYSIELGPHHLAATGVFDPRSDEMTWQIEHLEDVQFLRSGMGDYPEEKNHADFFNFGGFAKVQPYYARIAEIHAQRDDVKPFLRSYFNSLAAQVSAENLSLWEHFHNIAAWNKTHETGWFLCQTAMMLAMERGDELWLAPFVTSNWLKDGQTVAATKLPTRFGPVSYRLTSRVKDGVIEAHIEPPTRTAPKAIALRLRHPDGKPMRTVTVNGKPHDDLDPRCEIITLPNGARPMNIRAEY